YADQFAYNFDNATKYEIPTADAGVTLEQLYEDEAAINGFSDKGFFRTFVQSMVDDYKMQKEWELEWEKELEALEAAEAEEV
ncbi:hypothetical protein ACEXP9_21180, partial [Bacillus amyloliquefaciens]